MMKGINKMNELFEFHRKLNFKKIAIIIIFALFTIIVIFDILSFIFKSDDKKLDKTLQKTLIILIQFFMTLIIL